jgi:hypothetical protein
MTRDGATTFDADALWAKSTAFVHRGLRARDNGDELEFHLWCALALELVGKAALARFNPALVADPTDFGSLLYACGGKEPADKKSVTARTVFERLPHIVPKFDEQMKRQSTGIASRRNAELHSGESPTVALDQRAWVPTFWRCAVTIVEGQGRSVADWIGVEEATRVAAILADASRLTEQTVRARIARRRDEYEQRFSKGEEREAAATRAAARAAPNRLAAQADAVEEQSCPSCSSKAWLLGYESGEEVDGPHVDDDDDDGFYRYEFVTTFYSADSFRCTECGLSLDGREELDVAELPAEFQREETREAEYEEDYGND